jgi:hypothetical protein
MFKRSFSVMIISFSIVLSTHHKVQSWQSIALYGDGFQYYWNTKRRLHKGFGGDVVGS